MIICGVKVSHDGGVAVIDGNRLVFSVEVEKLENSRRYSNIGDLDLVTEILRSEHIDPREIDRYVVDGWFPPDGETLPWIPTARRGRPVRLQVAPYVGDESSNHPLHPHFFAGVEETALDRGYVSYAHASNHALGTYCSSPFAARGEDALVMAWDGGTLPRLYYVDAGKRDIEALGPLFPLVGNIFGQFCAQLDPFWRDTSRMNELQLELHELEIPGKAMAYAALGTVERAAFANFDKILDEINVVSVEGATLAGKEVVARRDELFPGLSNADLIASWQAYIGQTLLNNFEALLQQEFKGQYPNLCLGGGCALNIKWNSMLRAGGMFSDIWVPPFPNDSGAAIGTACCEMVRETRTMELEWNVYQGHALDDVRTPKDWPSRLCDERQLAEILHYEGEPVVVLYGKAELGPRALGNRSIIAPATDPAMKDRLNDIKGRAPYRPVAPICLESRASEVFSPGGADRYMVFEHHMQPGWAEKVPAVVHLDGSARLQTIDPAAANTCAGRILNEYERLSGIPVLCNTSANLSGHGFFSDVAVAAEWGRTRYVWANGVLYTNPKSLDGVSPQLHQSIGGQPECRMTF